MIYIFAVIEPAFSIGLHLETKLDSKHVFSFAQNMAASLSK